MDHKTNGSTLWVAIYILDNEYDHVFRGLPLLPPAICLAAVCCSLEKTRKQSTQTTTESMDAFSVLTHESAACENFKRTHRRGAEDAEKTFLIKKYSELSELCVSVVKY